MPAHDRPSTPRGAAGLPKKPKASSSQQSSSSARKVHRKRSASPIESITIDDDDEEETTPAKGKQPKTSSETPATKGPPSLLSRALSGASKEAAQQKAQKEDKALSTPNVKAQFEQQEDFISFDFDEPPARTRTPRFTPGADSRSRGGREASGSKRKLDEYEERDAEGTRRMQKRERERSTPWCDDPGVPWDQAENAINM